ncbi:hypothetical protein [Nostoc sp. DedQUE09]|uniref:hypothetical protein n=1 Tax=Nostoc sp. DedQUE09 TaxID=3075394 RepID=UPI002AD28D49|nr:hypothetical protein [Nostoc sp. DedQUE09]MDZ7950669.1 hypothetical protein [Nostoc sp. DedQUE09]
MHHHLKVSNCRLWRAVINRAGMRAGAARSDQDKPRREVQYHRQDISPVRFINLLAGWRYQLLTNS